MLVSRSITDHWASAAEDKNNLREVSGMGRKKALQVAPLITIIVYLLIGIADCTPGQPPRFTQEPVDTYVFELDENGQQATLTLSCGTDGDPTPVVTWFRSGVKVNSSLVLEDGTLAIANITEGESASQDGIPYYCTATNSLGTSRSITVRVFYAFFGGISAPSGHEFVNVTTTGHAVALMCDVSEASPPPVIEWLDDSGVISAEFDNVDYLNGGRYLLFRELTVEQLGKTYHCRVTNANIHNTVESSGNYTFNNLGADFPDNELIIYKELESEVIALVGEDAEFSFVGAASSALVTQYRLDGSTLGIETSGPLGIVRDVPLPSDGNRYNVTLTIGFGDADAIRTSTLTVYEPAAIEGVLPDEHDLDKFVGDKISLSCILAGTPTPNVVWYFNGEVLMANTGLNIDDDGNINILSLTTAHSGVYQCFVSNIARLVYASISLQIREPVQPQIFLMAPDGQSTEGEDIILICTFSGIPIPSITWLKDGTVLSPSDHIIIRLTSSNESQLLIREATPDDDGSYSCNASSIGGVQVVTVDVSVEGKAMLLSKTAITGIGCGAIVLLIAVPICICCVICRILDCRQKCLKKRLTYRLTASRNPETGDRDGLINGEERGDFQDSHSEEYEKLHIKSDVLVEKLAAVRCSENLAFKLRAKKIIPESVYDRATAPGPQMVQIRIIINAVLPKVDNSAENYRTFLCTLQEIDEDYPKIVDDGWVKVEKP